MESKLIFHYTEECYLVKYIKASDENFPVSMATRTINCDNETTEVFLSVPGTECLKLTHTFGFEGKSR
jgi:hypothetical protein